ncbi:MAG: cation:proton antiporter [Gammaproteobacteria bacterium]|nr:cation:proton antiporter [Gammaproteobacteria bacterium]
MEMHVALLALGGLFAAGLGIDLIGRRARLPRVTLLILFGVLAGPIGLDIVPAELNGWYDFLATLALTMVAFLLGGSLSRERLREHGRTILVISIAVVSATLVIVAGGLILVGIPPALALLLAGIATATAPAATLDVIRQTGAQGPFTETLQGIVAIDDAWGLIAFSLAMVAALALTGNDVGAALRHGVWDIGGAVAVGALVGFPAAALSGRLSSGEPTQIEALAVVFLCAGGAVWLGVSYLLAGVVAGAVVANFAGHHTRAFHEIENIEWPFMILFFFLGGVTLQVDGTRAFAVTIAAFVALRALARLVGAWIGARVAGADADYRRWMGLALLPQAGIAIGMALVARDSMAGLGQDILAVTIAATVLYEVIGPFATMLALRKVGETGVGRVAGNGERSHRASGG